MIGSTRYSLSPQMMQVTACLKSWNTSGALIAGFAGSAAGTSRSSAQPQPSRSAANEKRSNSAQINI